MAEARIDQKSGSRFFCHRCYVEFENVLSDYTCPHCVSGFIEQLEPEDVNLSIPAADYSSPGMSNIDETNNVIDSEEMPHLAQDPPPMSNDIVFVMSEEGFPTGRRETSMSQILFRNSVVRDAITAEAPIENVEDPDDYIFDDERMDAAVTQLLGQLENSESPFLTLPLEQIPVLPNEVLTENDTAANTSCSICWEKFEIGVMVSRLECDHMFHATCISPWLRVCATCPICRRSLLPQEPAPTEAPTAVSTSDTIPTAAPATVPALTITTAAATITTTATTTDLLPIASSSQLVLRRLPLRICSTLGSVLGSSSSSGLVSSATYRTTAPTYPPTTTSSTTSNPSSSSNATEHMSQYNLDIDYD